MKNITYKNAGNWKTDPRILRGISFLLPFTLYLYFISPGITGGDAGELSSVGYLLGIPHPPGYPLYTLLARLFSMLFPLNPAAGTNLLSALFGALTTFLLFIYLERKIDKLSAIFAALIFSLSPVFFSQAIRTEVYTITAFFFILELYLIEEKRYLILSYISGLSILVHPLLWLLFPWILFLIVKSYNKGILFIILGLSISLYLLIRAKLHPLINWGDPETISKFFYHLLRLEYYQEAPKYSLALIMGEYKIWFKALLITSNFGLLVSIYGAFFTKERRTLFILLFVYSIFLTFLIHSPVTSNRLYIVKIFYIPQLMLLIIFLGYGLANIKLKYRWLLFLFLIIENIFYAANEGIFWRNWTAEDFKNVALSQVAKGDVIISEGDALTFPLVYGSILTKKADVFDVHGDLRPKPRLDSIIEKNGYIWSTTPLKSIECYHIPYGLLWYNGVKPINNAVFDWNKINIRFGGQQNPLEKEIYIHYLLMKSLSSSIRKVEVISLTNRARKVAQKNPYLLNRIGTVLLRKELYEKAEEDFQTAVELDKGFSQAYHNLVLCYLSERRLKQAYNIVINGRKYADNAILDNDLGIILIKMGRINNARTMFFKAAEKGSKDGLSNFIRTLEKNSR